MPPPSESASERPDAQRLFRAIDPSEVAMSAEDLAAISIRANVTPALDPLPVIDEGAAADDDDAWDPMHSYAALDSTVPPSSDSTAGRRAKKREIAAVDIPPSVDPKSAQERIGDALAGRFELRRLLGEGGMASVFEAFDRKRQKPVALKLMHAGYANSPELVARFRREARAASAIASPNIVRILDVGRAQGAGLYLVMELFSGEDLSAVLRRVGRLSPRVACALIAQAANGLAAAHKAGVVHRDVKPGNLFLAREADGSIRLKVLDFGVAKPEDAQEGLTRVGTVVGTPQYMAPEQARAQADIGPRADVYALGAVLFEMLAGRPAYIEMPTIQETLYNVGTKAPPRLREVRSDASKELDSLVSDMMCREQDLRVGDMELLVQRLRHFGVSPNTPVKIEELESYSSDEARKRTTDRSHRAAPTIVRADAKPGVRGSAKWLPFVAAAVLVVAMVGGYLALR